jgi:predicted GNAT family acetyltransferase
MTWHLTESADDFWAAAGEFLRSRPVENSLPLTLIGTLRTRDLHYYGPADPVFGWWESAGEVIGICLQTPPHPLIIAGAPAAAMPSLAALLVEHALPSVNAVVETAEAFAAAWRELTGASAEVGMRTRLFRLDELTPPTPAPPGKARIADASDRELLVAWLTDFRADEDSERVADDKISHGGLTLWEIDGDPVSMAGVTRRESGVVRVAPVYTPPELRGRGYAGAATSAVTQAALDAGAEDVVLFTDQANPTSNALYQRLGYRPIEERVVLGFSS